MNATNRQNNTPIHEACCSGNYECAKYLLEDCHADPSIRNNFGMRARDLVRADAHFTALFDKYYKQNNLAIEATQAMPKLPQQPVFDFNTSHMGADALNISCTYREKKSGRAAKSAAGAGRVGDSKRVVLFRTSMTEVEKAQVSSLAEKMRIQVAKEMNNNGDWILFIF